MTQLIVPIAGGHHVQVTSHADWTEVELVRVNGNPETVNFLRGSFPNRQFCLPLGYRARIQVAPPGNVLDGTAYAKTGLVGARVAVADNVPGLKAAALASGLWLNKHGGPWAKETNRGTSYLYSSPDRVTNENVEAWIDICGQAKIKQLDWVNCFRYGDYEPWPRSYPGGLGEVVDLVQRLAKNGIASILHTFAPAIDEDAVLEFKADAKPHPNGFYLLTASDRLLEEVAGNIANVLDTCRFTGVYLDATEWCNEIEGRDWGWWWARRITHEIGKRLGYPDLIVESAMPDSNDWQVRSRVGSLDHPPTEEFRTFVDRCVAQHDPATLLPPVVGWLNILQAKNLGDVRYAISKAATIDAAIAWRNIAPSTMGNPLVAKAVKLIGER